MARRSRKLSDAVDLAVIDKDAAIFPISVAAELAGRHPAADPWTGSSVFHA